MPQARCSNVQDALNRLAKWRTVLTGKWIGTRSKSDPLSQSVNDVFEKLLLLRAEVSALTSVLNENPEFMPKFHKALIEEAWQLEKMYEEKFPGFAALEDGMSIDVVKAQQTMKGWPG